MKVFRVLMSVALLAFLGFATVQTVACSGQPENPNACSPACKDTEECKAGKCVAKETKKCDPACKDTEECKAGKCVAKEAKKCDPACKDTQECKEGKCVDEPSSQPAP